MAHVVLDLPLYHHFLSLDTEMKERFPVTENEYRHGIDTVGLSFCQHLPLRNSGYFCTPSNTVEFATTEQSGEHFSFLVEDGRVTENSPIVYTDPGGPPYNFIVANGFESFLQLGLLRGFFVLHQLSFNAARALEYLALPRGNTTKHNFADRYPLNDRESRALSFVAQSLNLDPKAYSISQFMAFQHFGDRLVMTDEFNCMFDDD